jgi:hypothetical protein
MIFTVLFTLHWSLLAFRNGTIAQRRGASRSCLINTENPRYGIDNALGCAFDGFVAGRRVAQQPFQRIL